MHMHVIQGLSWYFIDWALGDAGTTASTTMLGASGKTSGSALLAIVNVHFTTAKSNMH